MKIKLFPASGFCDALIDQNRFIGSDPVGYRCVNPPSLIDEFGHFLCLECADLLSTGRITLGITNYREAEYKTSDERLG